MSEQATPETQAARRTPAGPPLNSKAPTPELFSCQGELRLLERTSGDSSACRDGTESRSVSWNGPVATRPPSEREPAPVASLPADQCRPASARGAYPQV